ncbi:MAG: Uma2 family endonuclease [Plectolyngbya sp. WJT66-NPBG17]|jgi:Uma2 family endonuclease|nr:Uma2 family endonuclease [Plectolyngbya sp. WJT66-NPBG17]MBW4525741.1 Uma2 family endonuclease [Phormidium tanganyikae FI6-MK23]
MTQTKRRFTSIEEYLEYDDGSDRRYELVNGELIELPTESPQNLLIAAFLLVQFAQIGIPVYRLGIKHQIAVSSMEVTAREPDFMVHSEVSARVMLQQTQALLRQNAPAPLLVVEVVSPGKSGTENYDRDYVEKRREYAERGISEYWLIDPEREVILVLQLEAQQYIEVGEFKDRDVVASPTFSELQLTAEEVLRAGR